MQKWAEYKYSLTQDLAGGGKSNTTKAPFVSIYTDLYQKQQA